MNVELCALEEFFKKDYRAHVGKDDAIPHSVLHAFGIHEHSDGDDSNNAVDDGDGGPAACNGCLKPERFINMLQARVNSIQNKPTLITNITEKLRLAGLSFHKLRSHLFRGEYQAMECVKKILNMPRGAIYVIMDWKMKVMPRQNRETGTALYDKTGSFAHGAVVVFRVSDRASMDPMVLHGVRSVQPLLKTGDFEVHYVVQLVEETHRTKQDADLNTAVIEQLVLYLKANSERFVGEGEHLKEIIFQSDNAPNYNNSQLISLLPMLSIVHTIKLSAFVHNEPGFGKTILDAFFGVLTWHLERALREERLPTDTILIHNLAKAASGLRNATVQVVKWTDDAFVSVSRRSETVQLAMGEQRAPNSDSKAAPSSKRKRGRPAKEASEDLIVVDGEYPELKLTQMAANLPPIIDDISSFRDWEFSYDYERDEEEQGYHVKVTAAIGSTFTGATQHRPRIELSSNAAWNDALQQCIRDGCVAFSSAWNVFEDFDGYFFASKSARTGDTNSDSDSGPVMADAAAMNAMFQARTAIVGGAPCKVCGVVFTRQHTCRAPKKDRTAVDFAVAHGIQVMSSKWIVAPDMSTRIRIDDDALPSATVGSELATFPFGWAVTPDRSTTNVAATPNIFA